MKRDRAAVVGHINMDKELYLESFPSPGVSVSVRETQEHLGGCAATIAMTAARLGAEVSLYSVVGPDFPRGYIEELKATQSEAARQSEKFVSFTNSLSIDSWS